MCRQHLIFPTDVQGALSYIVWACGPQGAHLKPHEEHRRANLNSELKTKWNSRKALWRATLNVNNAKHSGNLTQIKNAKHLYRQNRIFPTDEQGALSYIVWACGPQGAHLKPHGEHRRANFNSEL